MPKQCPMNLNGAVCADCPQHCDDKCYWFYPSKQLTEILTDYERIERLEQMAHSPLVDGDLHIHYATKAQIQHLQAQVDYTESKVNSLPIEKVGERKAPPGSVKL